MNQLFLYQTVRVATAEDEDRLYKTLVALYQDNPIAGHYTESKVRQKIAEGTSKADVHGGVIGIIDGENGEIAGTIGIYPIEPWYSDQWHLAELWLFVHPDYRQYARHYRSLFMFARRYHELMTKSLGREIKLITSVSSNKRLSARLRLWSRFARMIGGIYLVED